MDIDKAISILELQKDLLSTTLSAIQGEKATLQLLRNQNDFLEGEKAGLSHRIKELEKENEGLKSAISHLRHRIMEFEHVINKDYRKKIENLQDELRTANDIETALRQLMEERFGVKIAKVIVSKEGEEDEEADIPQARMKVKAVGLPAFMQSIIDQLEEEEQNNNG